MRPQKKCLICENIITDAKRTKYCSLECSQIARKSYTNNWLNNNPGYMKAYFQEHKERYTRTARKERKQRKEVMEDVKANVVYT